MQKLVRTALDNRNRIATAALVATGTAMSTLASAQTLDGGTLASAASTQISGMMSQGGPAVFGLVGIATGAVWLINRVRSLG